jgi:MFS family permease
MLGAGMLAMAAFAAWERRAPAPMLPLRFFRARAFAAASLASLLAYFGLLGAIFLIGQLLQSGLGATPLEAGLGLLPWTAVVVVTVPAAGALCDRIGARPVMTGALAIETIAFAWIAVQAEPGVSYTALAPALLLAGVGAASLFMPAQAALLAAVRPQEHGQAAGAATAIRELGGVLGVAVLAAVFAANGSSASPAQFLTGLRPALAVAAVAVAVAMLAALALPGRHAAGGRVPAPQPAR